MGGPSANRRASLSGGKSEAWLKRRSNRARLFRRAPTANKTLPPPASSSTSSEVSAFASPSLALARPSRPYAFSALSSSRTWSTRVARCRSFAVRVRCSVSSVDRVQPFSISFSSRPEAATARAAAVRRRSVRVPKIEAILAVLPDTLVKFFWACVARRWVAAAAWRGGGVSRWRCRGGGVGWIEPLDKTAAGAASHRDVPGMYTGRGKKDLRHEGRALGLLARLGLLEGPLPRAVPVVGPLR